MTTNLIFTLKVLKVQRARASLALKQKQGVENSQWQKKKCTRQFARNVEPNVKSPSNPTPTGQFTAESAGQRNDPQDPDDTKPHTNPNQITSFLFWTHYVNSEPKKLKYVTTHQNNHAPVKTGFGLVVQPGMNA